MFEVWKKIVVVDSFATNEEYLRFATGCCEVNSRVKKMILRNDFPISNGKKEFSVVRAHLSLLGIEGVASMDGILSAGGKFGLKEFPPFLAPYVRREYQEQKNGECLNCAMNLIDKKILTVNHHKAGFCVGCSSGNSNGTWHSADQFLFVL